MRCELSRLSSPPNGGREPMLPPPLPRLSDDRIAPNKAMK
jgi:hypothetical protein